MAGGLFGVHNYRHGHVFIIFMRVPTKSTYLSSWEDCSRGSLFAVFTMCFYYSSLFVLFLPFFVPLFFVFLGVHCMASVKLAWHKHMCAFWDVI